MIFEQIINKVKEGQTFIPFYYNKCKVIMFYMNPDQRYFDCGFKKISPFEKCWIIEVINKENQNYIIAYRSTEELCEEDFNRWTYNIMISKI